MSPDRLVLVPLDGSEASQTAIAAARNLAKLTHGTIAFLHVRKESPQPEDQLKRELGLTGDDRLIQRLGAPAAEICRAATEQNAHVIVMSTHGSAGTMQAPFGRTLAGVIGSTDRPVLAIRPEIQESRLTLSKISQVILPLDGSPGSAAAVNAALNLTHNFGGRLALIHVPLCHKAPPGEPGSLAGPRYLDAPHHERIAWDQEFMRRFGPAERANSELIDLHTSPGDPVQEILRIAENRAADLIAIAWRRNLDSGRAEIAKRLLAESNCPILFVPARNQEDGR